MQDPRWDSPEQHKRIKALVSAARVETSPVPGSDNEFAVIVNGTKVGRILKLSKPNRVNGKNLQWVSAHGYIQGEQIQVPNATRALREVVLSHIAARVTGRMPAYEFLAQCEELVQLLGGTHNDEATRAKVGAYIPAHDSRIRVYKDNAVCIVKSLNSHALVVRRIADENPVLCRGQDGDVYRMHGEWVTLRAHVAQVLAKSQEIERKFLVNVRKVPKALFPAKLTQAYICEDPAVRVRYEGSQTKPDRAWITFKGEGALKHLELEFEVREGDTQKAVTLLHAMNQTGFIHKLRHEILVSEPNGKTRVWALDEFLGPPSIAGKFLAEVELPSEDTEFVKPDWASIEVTDDKRYSNVRLLKHGWPRS